MSERTGVSRRTELDVLRVFAFLCVAALHAITPYISSGYLYGSVSWYFCVAVNSVARTGVPIFFMLTGCLLLGRDTGVVEFYKKRLSRIAVPLLVWNVFYIFFAHFMSGKELSFSAFFSALLNNGSYYHLWYLYEILGVYLLLPFLSKVCRSSTPGENAVLVLIAAFPTAIRPFLNTHLPVYIYLFDPLLEGYLGYVVLGYVLSRVKVTGRSLALASASLALGLVIGIWGNIAASSPGNIVLPTNSGYAVNNYLCAGGIFMLARGIFGGAALPERTGRLLKSLSAATYPAYGIHASVLTLLESLSLALPNTVLIVLTAAVTACASLLFGLAARSTKPTRFLLG